MTTASNPRHRGPYAKTARVRQRVMDAGAAVFAESGFYATTMKGIAERAGISERGLAHHFPNKSDVLSAVLHRRETENARRVPAHAGIEALLGMLEVVADDLQHPELVELHTILSAEAAAPDHPGHDHYRERYELFRLYAAESFAAMRATGMITSPLSDAELAASYVALSDGLQLQWLYDRDSVDAASVLRRFLESIAGIDC